MRLGMMILAIVGSLGLAMTLSQSKDAAADDNPAKTLRHIVLYKFKDELKPRQVQEVVDAFAALPKKIDTVVGFEHGANISAEGKSEGMTHCFVVSFRDEKGRDAYLAHPAHLEYVKLAKDRREKVVVFDYWTK